MLQFIGQVQSAYDALNNEIDRTIFVIAALKKNIPILKLTLPIPLVTIIQVA